jgi:hypothetical protein
MVQLHAPSSPQLLIMGLDPPHNLATYGRVNSQHDEHDEEEDGPEVGSWKSPHGLGVNFKHESRA